MSKLTVGRAKCGVCTETGEKPVDMVYCTLCNTNDARYKKLLDDLNKRTRDTE